MLSKKLREAGAFILMVLGILIASSNPVYTVARVEFSGFVIGGLVFIGSLLYIFNLRT